LGAGAQTLSMTFTPDDAFAYDPVTVSVPLTVLKATPALSWPSPADIFPNTPLGAAQLNATADVAGAFVYAPASGTHLAAGTHTLSAAFTPADTANYATGTVTTSIQVQNRTPILLNPGDQANADGSPYAFAVGVDAPVGYWRFDDTTGS